MLDVGASLKPNSFLPSSALPITVQLWPRFAKNSGLVVPNEVERQNQKKLNLQLNFSLLTFISFFIENVTFF